MELPLGELLALATAACFAGSVVFFTRAGRRAGSLTINPIRLAIGFVYLCAYGAIVRSSPLPSDAPSSAWWWLGASGIVGFFLGDAFLFRAFLDAGPRLSSLLMSLAPPFAACFGFFFLGERIGWWGVAGMALTLAGIGLTLLDRPARMQRSEHHLRGIFFGVLGALGQGGGLVLSKRGMQLEGGGDYDAFGATQIRILFALVAFAILLLATRRGPAIAAALRDRVVMRDLALGAFVGPFVGVGFSLLSVQYVETGIASSIMATTPILIIPWAWLHDGDRPGWRGFVGTLFAVMGVAMLFVR